MANKRSAAKKTKDVDVDPKTKCKPHVDTHVDTHSGLKEHQIHMQCVQWFDAQYPKFSQLLFHPANGEARDAKTGAKLKKMGVRKGVSDLFLAVPKFIGHIPVHGVFIEIKSKKGRATDDQIKFAEAVLCNNYMHRFCYSLDDFISLITYYLKNI